MKEGELERGPEKNVGRNRVDNARSKSTLSYALQYLLVASTNKYSNIFAPDFCTANCEREAREAAVTREGNGLI